MLRSVPTLGPRLLAMVILVAAAGCSGDDGDPSEGDIGVAIDAADGSQPDGSDIDSNDSDAGDTDPGDTDPGDTAGDTAGDTDPGDTDPRDANSDAPTDTGPSSHPPEARGPHPVGHLELRMDDPTTDPPGRLRIGVWYPAAAAEGRRTRIANLIESGAFEAAPSASGTFPLVMFSHGNNGANFQSFSLYEHLASHGFVLAAPDHAGNGLTDSPSDEEMAAIATRRPDEVLRAMGVVEEDDVVGPLVDGTPRAISGHSFGGYTAIVLGGAWIDVPAALARCEAGSESDVFCPSMPYWDGGDRYDPPSGHEVFEAVLALAPGGYAAFGDEGLAAVDVPVFLMGGTDDEFTASDIEPLFDGLPGARLMMLVERGGHMMFTDICRIPGLTAVPELAELCDPETHIDTDRGWEITNTYATAFLRYVLNDDEEMRAWLDEDPVVAYDEATLRIEGEL